VLEDAVLGISIAGILLVMRAYLCCFHDCRIFSDLQGAQGMEINIETIKNI